MEGNPLSTEEIKKAIKEHIHHPYLDSFLEEPVIDEDKIFFLASVFHDSPYAEKLQKKLIVTSMLVQIALDTHDRVTLDDNVQESGQMKKQRQLTVLAGDYYSGLYYYLLSQLEDIQMIKTLASVIKEMNEAKMAVYYKKFGKATEFMEELKLVESVLIRQVAGQFGKETISRFAENWLARKKLIQEKDQFETTGQSRVFHLLTNGSAMTLSAEEAKAAVDVSIKTYTERAKIRAGDLPDYFFMSAEEMNSHLESFFRSAIKATEEG